MIRAAGAVLAVAVVLAVASPALADGYVVGDSLTRQTYAESGGWYVDAVNGRPLATSVQRVVRTARARPDDAVVVALGSNDVDRRSATMAADLAAVARTGHPCLIVTTVKGTGVTPFYAGGRWTEYARRWNRAVWASGMHVANWTPIARAHPGYFLADGLHLTDRGEAAYDAFLRAAAARHCP